MNASIVKNPLFMQIGEEIYTNPLPFLIVPEKTPTEKSTLIENSVRCDLIGARYYDADIGLWTSVDAARQHHSGYLYGSNNPINRIDPDGNQDFAAMYHQFVNALFTTDYVGRTKASVSSSVDAAGASFKRCIKDEGFSNGKSFVDGAAAVTGAGSVLFPPLLPAAGALTYLSASMTFAEDAVLYSEGNLTFEKGVMDAASFAVPEAIGSLGALAPTAKQIIDQTANGVGAAMSTGNILVEQQQK